MEHYEEFSDVENKAELLENNPKSSAWFFNPSSHGFGSVNYVLDSDGNALYVFDRNGLPKEVTDFLKGGYANGSDYESYKSLSDVYGITKDLKIYYCENGKDTIIGITKEQLDKDDPSRPVLKDSSELFGLLTDFDKDGSGSLSVSEVRQISDISIGSDDSVSSLKDFYNLVSLEELTIKNKSNFDLSGIKYITFLKKLTIQDSTIKDYSLLQSKGNTLNKLYFVFTESFTEAQNEASKILNKEKPTSLCSISFNNLEYFGICGYNLPGFQAEKNLSFNSTSYLCPERRNNISDLSGMKDLNSVTKSKIKYLYLNNNNIENLNFITSDFSGLIGIRGDVNKLSVIKSIYSCANLEYLILKSNQIGKDETENVSTHALYGINALTKLKVFDIEGNDKLKYIGYISGNSKLFSLRLLNCSSMINDEVSKIKTIYNNIVESYRSIDSKYYSLFVTEEKKDYYYSNLKDDSIELSGLDNTVLYLRLDGNTELTNNRLQTVLSHCTSLKTLSLVNISNLTELTFIQYMPNIVELDLRGTGITDLELLNDCSKLNILMIDNSEIDLTAIQDCISNLGRRGTSTKTFTTYQSMGLVITGGDLFEKLSLCSEITSFYSQYQSGFLEKTSAGKTPIADLHNCSNMTYFYSKNCDGKVVLPGSLSKAEFLQRSAYYPADLSYCTNLTSIFFGHCVVISQATADKWFDEISKNCPNIETINIKEMGCKDGNLLNSVCKLKAVYEMDKSGNPVLVSGCPNLKEFNMNDNTYARAIGSLSGLGDLKSLETIDLTRRKLSDISELARLPNLKTLKISNNSITNIQVLAPVYEEDEKGNLILVSGCPNMEVLEANNNNIVNLKGLELLTNLRTLNLSSNNIYDIESYNNGTENVTYKSLQAIYDLNYNNSGSLRTVYLSNNKFNSYDLISSLSWDGKDF